MEYRLATTSDADEIARITHACSPELRDNFTMRLGLAFHRVYYRCLLAEPSSIVVCAERGEDSALSGFALGTLDSEAMLSALRSARNSLALASLLGVLRRPWLLVGLVQRAWCLVMTRRVDRYVQDAGAKVSFLAVDPTMRSTHAGPKLMMHAIKRMRQAGASAIRAEVDESNPKVIKLHQRLGATKTKHYTTPNGVKRVILEYAASDKQAAA